MFKSTLNLFSIQITLRKHCNEIRDPTYFHHNANLTTTQKTNSSAQIEVWKQKLVYDHLQTKNGTLINQGLKWVVAILPTKYLFSVHFLCCLLSLLRRGKKLDSQSTESI